MISKCNPLNCILAPRNRLLRLLPASEHDSDDDDENNDVGDIHYDQIVMASSNLRWAWRLKCGTAHQDLVGATVWGDLSLLMRTPVIFGHNQIYAE